MTYNITEKDVKELLQIASAIVRNRIKRGLFPPQDYDDLVQELLLIMLEHQDDWVIKEGYDLMTLAKVAMPRRIVSIYRNRKKFYEMQKNTVSLFCNEDGEDDIGYWNDSLSDVGLLAKNDNVRAKMDRLDRINDVRDFLQTLSPEERELCENLMFCSNTKTAKTLNISRQTVWRRKQEIRRKMEKAGING